MSIEKAQVIAHDKRGDLIRLFEDKSFSVLYATSKKGSVRANHYHKIGSHYCYITKGYGIYSYRNVGDQNPPIVNTFGPGDLIHTGPMIEHKFTFLERSEFITISPHSREQEHYEDDLVRVSI